MILQQCLFDNGATGISLNLNRTYDAIFGKTMKQYNKRKGAQNPSTLSHEIVEVSWIESRNRIKRTRLILTNH